MKQEINILAIMEHKNNQMTQVQEKFILIIIMDKLFKTLQIKNNQLKRDINQNPY